VEFWRNPLSNRHPLIVENGGALHVPPGYFPTPFHAPAWRDGTPSLSSARVTRRLFQGFAQPPSGAAAPSQASTT
jgi:hypothetical protein